MVRVRFAPSPTGELHVGGARTALFNWLYARKHNGVFVLRIEDTDKARSDETMTKHILEGMQWLGLEWDEGPFYQSDRVQEHLAYSQDLLERDSAYYDFSDPEQIAAARKEAQLNRQAYKYDRAGMETDIDKAKARIAAGERAAIRFKVPDGETIYQDMVHGEVRFQNDKLEDFVIVRSDSSPTYMLSVVADDIKMGMTHVIRGDDHIANTPKQILLYQALGKEPPQFGHLPLILGPDKKKLSKRHGGNTMKDYMTEGYLPQSVFNFLALLGWNPGDEREMMDAAALVDAFSFDGIGNSAAIFGLDKLEWINSQWINKLPFDQLLPAVKEEMEKLGTWSDDLLGDRVEWFMKVVELLKDRSRRTWDIARDGAFFFRPPRQFDEKAVKKFCKGEELPKQICSLAERLEVLDSWKGEEIESALRSLAEELAIGAGKLIHPLRIGMTGLGVTPDLFTIATMLSKDEVVARLRKFADYLLNISSNE